MTVSPVSAAGGTPSRADSGFAFSERADTETFLQLLVAQIKNQDPLSPQDPTAFISQLAEFSSLEQLISINDRMEIIAAEATDRRGLLEFPTGVTLQMPSAFFTGLSGLRAHSRAVEVVANNLANLNTISFKGSRSDFRDLFYQNIGQSRSGVASQVGIGTSPITVSRRFEQGTIQNSGGLLDAAIQGEGFFIVKDGDLVQYTRAGNFQLNADQELVTINGESVQGWVRRNGQVNVLTEPQGITLQGNDRIEPTATTTISISANLESDSTDAFSRPIQIFDSLGSPHVLTLTFTPTTPTGANANAFTVTATLPASDLVDTSVAPPVPAVADGNIILNTAQPLVLEFGPDGALDTTGLSGTPLAVTLDMASNNLGYANGADATVTIDWVLEDEFGQTKLTSVAAPSAVTDIFQNGSASAELTSISIADSGKINGIYSDGGRCCSPNWCWRGSPTRRRCRRPATTTTWPARRPACRSKDRPTPPGWARSSAYRSRLRTSILLRSSPTC